MVARVWIITDLSDAPRGRVVHSGRRSVCDDQTSKAADIKQEQPMSLPKEASRAHAYILTAESREAGSM